MILYYITITIIIIHLHILRRTSAMKEKPAVIADYNTYMLGVDKMDQLVSYYSFTHKSVKWWRKVFSGYWRLPQSIHISYIKTRQ